MDKKPRRTLSATDWQWGLRMARSAISIAVSPDPRTNTRWLSNIEGSLYWDEWMIVPRKGVLVFLVLLVTLELSSDAKMEGM
mmetsp:Transcript_15207/g.17481  ORF Transcript_15207/g.17481 Transcript_15207/m.17481 type:complete len:82 (-) Transcript_15207:111-356(-)